MVELPPLDSEVIRIFTGPKSDWAQECGAAVEKRRTDLGFTRAQVARATDTTEMTIFRVEKGELVPRDYLRLCLAMTLFCEVDDLFQPLSRQELQKRLAAAS